MAFTRNQNALSLILDYDSESDIDSGYTSDNEKKRKFDTVTEDNKKKLKTCNNVEMIGDFQNITFSESSSSLHKRFGTDEDASGNNKKARTDEQFYVLPNKTMMLDINQPNYHTRNNSNDCKTEHKSKIGNIPLPEELKSYSDNIDDPNNHQGRVRAIAHDRGNWASFANIPLDFGIYTSSIESLTSSLVELCKEKDIKMIPSSELHISLSQTLILRLHWIQPIVEELRRILAYSPKLTLCLNGLNVYCNEERTRTFLGIKVSDGYSELKGIVSKIDECFKDYKLPLFYEDGSFHVSIAWANGNCSKKLERILPSLQEICNNYFSIEDEMSIFNVCEIIFKTGNRIHRIPLAGL